MSRITIITSTLNAREALQETADSLREQTCRDALQWVIADGGSTDGTLEVIERNSGLIDYWHSQKDTGIYNAWNTLLPHVYGDWVLVLGAGDRLAHERVVEQLIPALADIPPETLWVYAQVNLVGRGLSLKAGKKWEEEAPNFFAYMTIGHQGVLVRRIVFSRLGPFSEKYRIAGDFEFLLRLVKNGHLPRHLPFLISVMKSDGLSNHPKSAMTIARETLAVRRDLEIHPLYPWRWCVFAFNIAVFTTLYTIFGQGVADGIRRIVLLGIDKRARD